MSEHKTAIVPFIDLLPELYESARCRNLIYHYNLRGSEEDARRFMKGAYEDAVTLAANRDQL